MMWSHIAISFLPIAVALSATGLPTGYTSEPIPQNAAINAPLNCIGENTYMGAKTFKTSSLDIESCATACTAQSAYNLRHPPSQGKPKTCQFFNTYLLYKNGVYYEQRCTLYTQFWDRSYARNTGYTSGKDKYTIFASFSFSNATNKGVEDCSSLPVSSTSIASSTTSMHTEGSTSTSSSTEILSPTETNFSTTPTILYTPSISITSSDASTIFTKPTSSSEASQSTSSTVYSTSATSSTIFSETSAPPIPSDPSTSSSGVTSTNSSLEPSKTLSTSVESDTTSSSTSSLAESTTKTSSPSSTSSTEIITSTSVLESSSTSTSSSTSSVESASTTSTDISTTTSMTSIPVPTWIQNGDFESTANAGAPWVIPSSSPTGCTWEIVESADAVNGTHFAIVTCKNAGEGIFITQPFQALDIGATYVVSVWYRKLAQTTDSAGFSCTLGISNGPGLIASGNLGPNNPWNKQVNTFKATAAYPGIGLFCFRAVNGGAPNGVATYTYIDSIDVYRIPDRPEIVINGGLEDSSISTEPWRIDTNSTRTTATSGTIAIAQTDPINQAYKGTNYLAISLPGSSTGTFLYLEIPISVTSPIRYLISYFTRTTTPGLLNVRLMLTNDDFSKSTNIVSGTPMNPTITWAQKTNLRFQVQGWETKLVFVFLRTTASPSTVVECFIDELTISEYGP